MRIYYVIGKDGAGKTTLTSIMAYNLFLRNHQVAIVDLTDSGKGYFFRFGACDFFALGDGSVNIPRKLLVTLQDIGISMHAEPELCLHSLPLMPGLKICCTAPDTPEKKIALATSFLEIYRQSFNIAFVEMTPPLQFTNKINKEDRVLVICSDTQDDWVQRDEQLMSIHTVNPEQVKVILNRQKDSIIAATRFVKNNKLGVDYILDSDQEVLANSTVMELCKKMKHSRFLKQLVPIIYCL
jgi:hypothetical protein